MARTRGYPGKNAHRARNHSARSLRAASQANQDDQFVVPNSPPVYRSPPVSPWSQPPEPVQFVEEDEPTTQSEVHGDLSARPYWEAMPRTPFGVSVDQSDQVTVNDGPETHPAFQTSHLIPHIDHLTVNDGPETHPAFQISHVVPHTASGAPVRHTTFQNGPPFEFSVNEEACRIAVQRAHQAAHQRAEERDRAPAPPQPFGSPDLALVVPNSPIGDLPIPDLNDFVPLVDYNGGNPLMGELTQGIFPIADEWVVHHPLSHVVGSVRSPDHSLEEAQPSPQNDQQPFPLTALPSPGSEMEGVDEGLFGSQGVEYGIHLVTHVPEPNPPLNLVRKAKDPPFFSKINTGSLAPLFTDDEIRRLEGLGLKVARIESPFGIEPFNPYWCGRRVDELLSANGTELIPLSTIRPLLSICGFKDCPWVQQATDYVQSMVGGEGTAKKDLIRADELQFFLRCTGLLSIEPEMTNEIFWLCNVRYVQEVQDDLASGCSTSEASHQQPYVTNESAPTVSQTPHPSGNWEVPHHRILSYQDEVDTMAWLGLEEPADEYLFGLNSWQERFNLDWLRKRTEALLLHNQGRNIAVQDVVTVLNVCGWPRSPRRDAMVEYVQGTLRQNGFNDQVLPAQTLLEIFRHETFAAG